jgi:mannose-6-phosphate isomerase-like protein (cupin superfamily)
MAVSLRLQSKRKPTAYSETSSSSKLLIYLKAARMGGLTFPMKPISKDTAEHYTWGGNCDGWFLLKGDDVHVIQERMPAGASEVAHFHRRSRQMFFVLRGELTMKFESDSMTLAAGQSLAIEPNRVHQAVNESGEDVEFLVVSCPPSHEDRFAPE